MLGMQNQEEENKKGEREEANFQMEENDKNIEY